MDIYGRLGTQLSVLTPNLKEHAILVYVLEILIEV